LTATITPLRRTDERSIQEQFEVFHAENPQVYVELVKAARRWRELHGPFSTCGIGFLWERARWVLSMKTTGSVYKLNNNLRSRYARLIVEQEPDLDGVFHTRELRAA
jgi:hypothetical protein